MNDEARGAERKPWLETLLDRMTAPADVMRHHLGATSQWAAMGSAAEAGVRDLLRLVLPKKLAIATGFIRDPGEPVAEPSKATSLSGQTDVIVYDAAYSVPLHSIGGVEVVAAPDVLGVFEVKDTNGGGAALSGKEGALEHIGTRVGPHVEEALRCIVLCRGNNKPKEKSELKSVVEQMESAQLDSGSSPHVIYCARGATLSEAGTYGGYLVVHDELTKSIHGHELADETMALAGFLRVVTGFFAASGLLSSSMHIDLAPQGTVPSPIRVELADAKPPFKRLHEELLARRPSNEPFDELLIRWLSEMKSGTTSIDRRGGDMKWKVATGHDAEGAPTAGFMLSVSAVSAGDPDYAAFFYRRKIRELVCCDSSADAVDRWPISETNGDTFSSYMLRIMLEAERRRQALRGPAEK